METPIVVLKCNPLHIILIIVGCTWITTLAVLWDEINIHGSCVDKWSSWICEVGNLSGLFSSFFWSICIIPQIWFNYERGGTKGLSLRWACANVIAALVNLNFVLRISAPLYISISAVYMPILEMFILYQFSALSDIPNIRMTARLVFVTLFFSIVFTVIFWNVFGLYADALEWMAVCLWSIETLPQIWLNARNHSTEGQSTHTITISFLGKTTDFLSMSCLNLPVQFRVMTFFSTAAAYVNISQFLYYRGNRVLPIIIVCMVILFSIVMAIKVGWMVAVLLPVLMLMMLVGGYWCDNILFQRIGMASELEVHEQDDPATTSLLSA